MSSYYLDASALVKCYVYETGNRWVRSLLSPAASLAFTSRMSIVEVVSAFARRLRETALTNEEFIAARDMFFSDCQHYYQIVPPAAEVIAQACALLERHALRAYDATHLATALQIQHFFAARTYAPLIFVSADDRLNAAALVEGLSIENPNQHK